MSESPHMIYLYRASVHLSAATLKKEYFEILFPWKLDSMTYLEKQRALYSAKII